MHPDHAGRSNANRVSDLGIDAVCAGIETVGEHDVLRDLGVSLMQGYLLAKPEVETLPPVVLPRTASGMLKRA